MSNNHLYTKRGVPNDVQRLVLELWRENKDTLEISRTTKVHLKQVEAIIENGIVALRSTKKKRCKCGAKVVRVPCLSCQLAGVGS